MSEISERYRRLGDAFADKISSVPKDRWDSRTPCEEWTARDLVGHVVTAQGMFLGFIGKDPGDIPSVDHDPVGAWGATRAKVQAVLDDPQQAKTEFQGFSGRSTFEAAVNRFLCTDLVVHGWDLARATGLDETIDPQDLVMVKRDMEAMGDAMRSPGAFGPAVEPPAEASEQQQVLAFLGRRA
ncbi:MAG: TIGR03086 family protein [Acidimicrobiia bacterium]|nr:TIGR03086 family protein [Acidimicrobiia bacterium]